VYVCGWVGGCGGGGWVSGYGCGCGWVGVYMCRVGPNRMTVYTPYPRYAVYPVPYMTLSHRFRNRMTVYGFQQAVFAGGAGLDSQQQQSLLLFLVKFFSRASSHSCKRSSYKLFVMKQTILSSSFASLFY